MSYSAVGLEATYTINNNQGFAVNANLASRLTTYNSLPTVSLTSAMFATAASVADTGLLTNTLMTLGNIGPVLFGVAPTTGVPNFTANINTQSMAPFTNGVGGFANVVMQVMPFIMQSYDVASSAQLVKNKTYETSGSGYRSRLDLVTAGFGTSAPVLGKAVAGFGTMFDINNIEMLNDPYVFVNNLLSQGLGSVGNLYGMLSDVGLTKYNILTPPTDVSGNSPDVLISVLQQVQGQDLLDIISATRFTSVGSNTVTSLADMLNLQKLLPMDTVNQLAAIGISDLAGLSAYLHNTIGSGSFTSFADLSNILLSIVVPVLSNVKIAPADPVVSSTALTALTSITGTGAGPFGNPTLPDILGCCSGIPYVDNFANINATIQSIDTSTIVTNLGQVYSAANTYIAGGNWNSTTVAPVATAIQNLSANVTTLLNGSKLGTAQSLYSSCYSSYTNEVLLQKISGTIITNPNASPNRLPDLARTITSIGTDVNKLGLVRFFNAVANTDVSGDSIKSAIAENYNSQILQSKGVTFKNTVEPTQKLAQAQKLGISISQLQQLVK